MYTVKSNELNYFEQISPGIAVFYSIRLTIHQMCLFYFINSAANSNPYYHAYRFTSDIHARSFIYYYVTDKLRK